MESFLSSTTKLCNDLPDFIKISSTLSSFKKHLKEFFCKTSNDLYHFGARRCIGQLINFSSNFIRTCLFITCLTHQLAETVTAKLRTPFITFLNVQHFNYTIREVLFENILTYILMTFYT